MASRRPSSTSLALLDDFNFHASAMHSRPRRSSITPSVAGVDLISTSYDKNGLLLSSDMVDSMLYDINEATNELANKLQPELKCCGTHYGTLSDMIAHYELNHVKFGSFGMEGAKQEARPDKHLHLGYQDSLDQYGFPTPSPSPLQQNDTVDQVKTSRPLLRRRSSTKNLSTLVTNKRFKSASNENPSKKTHDLQSPFNWMLPPPPSAHMDDPSSASINEMFLASQEMSSAVMTPGLMSSDSLLMMTQAPQFNGLNAVEQQDIKASEDMYSLGNIAGHFQQEMTPLPNEPIQPWMSGLLQSIPYMPYGITMTQDRLEQSQNNFKSKKNSFSRNSMSPSFKHLSNDTYKANKGSPTPSAITINSEMSNQSTVEYACPKPNCTKVYKNSNGLKYHLKKGNCEFDATNVDDEAIPDEKRGGVRIARRPFMCLICNRRYKNANGLKYHAGVEHPHVPIDQIHSQDE